MSRDDETAKETAGDTRAERPERTSKPKLVRAPDFGERYEVRAVLGKGGMGEVFRAFDRKLDTEVALKVVTSDDDAALARFRREINLSRRVTNANVLRVYDLAEHDGLTFLSMELVDGDDLAKLLKRDGKLPHDRAVALFRQVCVGVAAAHAQGVVHRDLKPQNVLVGAGDAVRVADFGIARSIGESGLTATGAQVGSPAYMAPEQVKGEPADHRADIYALGIMLYQLVAGTTPFVADTPHAVMEMRLHKPPRPLHDAAPDAPAYLGAIVERCLALAPGDRYSSVADILADLDAKHAMTLPVQRNTTMRSSPTIDSGRAAGARTRTLLALGAAAIAVGAAATFGLRAMRSTSPAVAPTRAAVAPVATSAPSAFAVDSNNPALGLLPHPDNATDDLTLDAIDFTFSNLLRDHSTRVEPLAGAWLKTALSHAEKGHTTLDDAIEAKLSSMRHQQVSILRIAIARDGTGYRVRARVTDAPTGTLRLERDITVAAASDVIPACKKIADAVRTSFGEVVDPEVPLGQSTNLEVNYELALSDDATNSGNEAIALSRLRHAVELAPNDGQTHYRIGIAEMNLGHAATAALAYRRAFELQDELTPLRRHVVRAAYLMYALGDVNRAVDEFRALIEKKPFATTTMANLAAAYFQLHDATRALEYGLRVVTRDPEHTAARANLIAFYLVAGQFDRAESEAKAVIAEFPRYGSSHLYGALAAWLLDHGDVATTEIAAVGEDAPSDAVSVNADRMIAEGRLAAARTVLVAGLADDAKHKNADGLEIKSLLLADLERRAGSKAAALAATAKVTADPVRRFHAAMIELALGDRKPPLATMSSLRDEVSPESRAEARILEAELAHVRGALDESIAGYHAATKFNDAWESHYFLARVYLDAKRYADAKAELDTCWKRRGDVALRFDDTTMLRWVTPIQYDLGRALEGLGDAAGAKAAYDKFLAMQPHADNYPMLVDAKARLAKLEAR